MTEQFSSRQIQMQDQIGDLAIQAKLCNQLMLERVPQPERDLYEAHITNDTLVNKEIQKLKGQWLKSTANPKVFKPMCDEVII